MRLSFFLAAAGLAAGCGGFDDSAGFSDSFQDDDPPIGDCPGTTCPETTVGDSAAGAGEPCDDTNQCSSGFCAAPFSDGEAGELVCQTACIQTLDDTMWCSDTAACCDADAVCGSRGYCELPEGLDDTGGDTADSGTSSGGDSGTMTDGDTSGSGSDTGSGSTSDSGSGSDESGATTAGTGS